MLNGAPTHLAKMRAKSHAKWHGNKVPCVLVRPNPQKKKKSNEVCWRNLYVVGRLFKLMGCPTQRMVMCENSCVHMNLALLKCQVRHFNKVLKKKTELAH